MLVIRVEGRAIACQPLLPLVLPNALGNASFEHLEEIELEALGLLKQITVDAEMDGYLAPA